MKPESKNVFTDKQICIVGTGGFAREVYCCLEDVYAAKGLSMDGKVVFSDVDACAQEYVCMGDGKMIEVIKESKLNFGQFIFFIGVGDPKVREKIVNKYPSDVQYATIIHPSAVISEQVEIGEGSIITAGCIITCNIKIGHHAHLNLHTTIGHDCVIGDFFTTAPAANISGNCVFGNGVYFGTNSCARQGTTICDDVTIGMGGVVLNDITEPGVYVGVPVKKR